jgi:hypothetical protein
MAELRYDVLLWHNSADRQAIEHRSLPEIYDVNI